MITAILLPASLGACAFFTILALLEGVDPPMRNCIIVSGAIAALFGVIWARKLVRSKRKTSGVLEAARRILFAAGFTSAAAFCAYVAFDSGSKLAQHSTSGALMSQRDRIAAEQRREDELIQIVQNQQQLPIQRRDFTALSQLESVRDRIALYKRDLAIYETANVRILSSKIIVFSLGAFAIVAWASTIRLFVSHSPASAISELAAVNGGTSAP